jgi:hypothetical protein
MHPMTESPSAQPQVAAASEADFPPQDPEQFLRLCAGEWMSLRSQFLLGLAAEAEAHGQAPNDDANTNDEASWHTSERGELVVQYLETAAPGGLQIAAKRDGALQAPTQLSFCDDGQFSSSTGAQGTWTLWPDGSLELVSQVGDTELREKIWFTKPNLRLRSTVEHRADGSPGRASFSSEIRRVSRPAA